MLGFWLYRIAFVIISTPVLQWGDLTQESCITAGDMVPKCVSTSVPMDYVQCNLIAFEERCTIDPAHISLNVKAWIKVDMAFSDLAEVRSIWLLRKILSN